MPDLWPAIAATQGRAVRRWGTTLSEYLKNVIVQRPKEPL